MPDADKSDTRQNSEKTVADLFGDRLFFIDQLQ